MRRKRGEGSVQIGTLFSRYKKLLVPPERVVVSEFQNIIEELFSVQIPREQCSYRPATYILQVRVSGAFKSEIFIHKEKILTLLKTRLGEKNAPKNIL